MIKNSKSSKVTFKEFLSIQIWSFKLNFKISGFKFIFYLIANALTYLQSLVFPFFFAKVLDEIISAKELVVPSWDRILFYLIIYFGIDLFFSALHLYRGHLDTVISDEIFRDSKMHMAKSLHLAGIEKLENPEIANIIQRADEHLYALDNQRSSFSNFFAHIISLMTQVTVIYSFAPIFIPVFIIFIIPRTLVDRYYMKKLWQHSKDKTEENRSSEDSASCVREPRYIFEVLITNTLHYFQNRYLSFENEFIKHKNHIRKVWFIKYYFFEATINLIRFFSNLYIIKEFFINKITIGQVTFYINILGQFLSSLERLASSYTNLFERAQRISEIKTIFELEHEKDGNIKIDLLTKGPEINFKDVNFSYPSSKKLVLKNINLFIKRGEKIAIVGHNGAGKTTLVKLICRFYRPTSGEIDINGMPLDNLVRENWHQNIGALFQEYNTYGNLTVAENLALSKTIDYKKVKEALLQADAYEFVKKLPQKEKQILSERYKGGTKLSTGQWQKIAVARFFYRNSPLVIFDEPTASIDAQSEKKIFDRIYKFFKNKTVIIISHRFSTVRNADRIIVIHDGEIVEEGSHQVLMKKDGLYAQSFKLQAEGYI